MNYKVTKRTGDVIPLDVLKIKKMTQLACRDLQGVNAEELEVDSQLQFVDGIKTKDIQDTLIKTAADKIDIDVPNWTFVASRLSLFDLYHEYGRALNLKKGEPYCHLEKHINNAVKENKFMPGLGDLYDLNDLNDYLKPERDYQFNYLGFKTIYDRYLIRDSESNVIELPQFLFMGVAMFLASNEEPDARQHWAKQYYDIMSKFEVMAATPTLSNARTLHSQCSSCYINSASDNIEGIFDTYKEMALLSKFGGGIGSDWNLIRMMGSDIREVKDASGGVVPALKIVNDIGIYVDQLGK